MATNDSAAGGGSPSGATVPLLVQPDALKAAAQRFEAIAKSLAASLGTARASFPIAPAGADEVSVLAANEFGKQASEVATQIEASITQLRHAADNCRTSAQQYRQTDALPY